MRPEIAEADSRSSKNISRKVRETADPSASLLMDVVLFKENHTQPTEAATLDRKSGEGEGSAAPRSLAPVTTLYRTTIPSFVIGSR
jgi:hypothetical protein